MSEYYTVTEFAELYGKDPGNVRRMLIKGLIKGDKLGKQWIIPKDATYPEDNRVKNGSYKNWRKRTTINQAHPNLLLSLKEMSERLCAVYGASLDKVILYGSYARGEQTEESDVDIAVILKDGNTEKMHDDMLDIVVDYELDLDVTLSVVPIEYANYLEWNKELPFYQNIEKEGIVLWQAA